MTQERPVSIQAPKPRPAPRKPRKLSLKQLLAKKAEVEKLLETLDPDILEAKRNDFRKLKHILGKAAAEDGVKYRSTVAALQPAIRRTIKSKDDLDFLNEQKWLEA